MKHSRLLILGSSGQVGQELMNIALSDPKIEAVGRSRSGGPPGFDLTDPSGTEKLVEVLRPRHTILAAAATNVAWCETHPAESLAINVTGTVAVARACERIESTLTFLSTDYVFDGTMAPSSEDDPTNPLNVYGRQKLAAEEAAAAACGQTLVIRTCQVFGRDRRRANFVLRAVDQLRDGGTVDAPTNLFGTPTYAPYLAREVIALTLSAATGVWHVAGASFVSRYELALATARAFGIDPAGIMKSEAQHLSDGVLRPLRSGLSCGRLTAAEMYAPGSLEDALSDLAEAELAA
jgi:dTDP-4-dehydrorhamnose reductase